MALTKKFFTGLAADYRAARPVTSDATGQFGTDYAIWEQMVRVTAAALKANNGAFNTERFYEACGITAE